MEKKRIKLQKQLCVRVHSRHTLRRSAIFCRKKREGVGRFQPEMSGWHPRGGVAVGDAYDAYHIQLHFTKYTFSVLDDFANCGMPNRSALSPWVDMCLL